MLSSTKKKKGDFKLQQLCEKYLHDLKIPRTIKDSYFIRLEGNT